MGATNSSGGGPNARARTSPSWSLGGVPPKVAITPAAIRVRRRRRRAAAATATTTTPRRLRATASRRALADARTGPSTTSGPNPPAGQSTVTVYPPLGKMGVSAAKPAVVPSTVTEAHMSVWPSPPWTQVAASGRPGPETV